MLQSGLSGLRDQSSWKERRDGLRPDRSGGGVNGLVASEQSMSGKSIDRWSDARMRMAMVVLGVASEKT